MNENNKVKDLKEKALELDVSQTDIDNCNNEVECIENLIKSAIEYKNLAIKAEKEGERKKFESVKNSVSATIRNT